MRIVRRIALLAVGFVAVFGLTAVALVTPSGQPASAASSIRLFEAYGQWAVGAPNLVEGNPVKETVSGRDLIIAPQVGSRTNLKLEFAQNTTACVATVDGTQAVIVEGCGGNGTLWQEVAASCSQCFKFYNNRQSNLLGQAVYLYGANNGTNMYWAINNDPGFKVFQIQGP